MAANNGSFQKGNSMWKARSKSGRDKIFATPSDLWAAACEYFTWAEENPLYEYDVRTVDKELQEVSIPRMRPLTLMGMCLFLHVNTAYFRKFRQNLRDKEEQLKQQPDSPEKKIALNQIADFDTVIGAIDETIYTQKFEGASSGFFNANIISRDLGLADKKEIQANVNLSDKPIEFE